MRNKMMREANAQLAYDNACVGNAAHQDGVESTRVLSPHKAGNYKWLKEM